MAEHSKFLLFSFLLNSHHPNYMLLQLIKKLKFLSLKPLSQQSNTELVSFFAITNIKAAPFIILAVVFCFLDRKECNFCLQAKSTNKKKNKNKKQKSQGAPQERQRQYDN
jgi:hypothetical protein